MHNQHPGPEDSRQDEGRLSQTSAPITRRDALRRAASTVFTGGILGVSGCKDGSSTTGPGQGAAPGSNNNNISTGQPSRPFLEYHPLPYEMRGVRIAGVVIREGRPGVFQDMVDRTINAATSAGRFQISPLFSGFGIMGVFHFDEVQSRAPCSWGYMSYDECSLSLLLNDTALNGVEALTTQFIFNPVMLLNDSYTFIAGREIYGFPKMLGKFATTGFPDGDGCDNHPIDEVTASVSVQGFATNSPREKADWQPVFDLKVTPIGINNDGLDGEKPRVFMERIKDLTDDPEWMVQRSLLDENLQGVFLKRFPESGSVTGMCYQSVVGAPYRPVRLRRFRFASGEVTFRNPASYPLAEALGYTPDQSGSFRAVGKTAFIADTDWELHAGREI